MNVTHILSQNSDASEHGIYLHVGTQACLNKPIQAGQLALAVRAALDEQPSSDDICGNPVG
jgi:DNA-binding response OmpR family regulator